MAGRARSTTRPPRVEPESPAGLLVRLRGLRPSLSPAEDRVAERVLADPRAAAALTISELADAARTSETTVLRFCKRLGMPGYPQLRLALASAVEETPQQLDREALTRAADAIAAATRVDLYGIAASGVVALDAQQKLHRIGVLAFAWNDPHVALTSATLLGPGDVAIGISHSGTTKETIESLAKARSRGATTIAITNFPLSRLVGTADIVLTTAARETSLRSGATASRIAALTVVDCLYITVAHRDLDRATKAVAETRAAVAGHHV
jgi:DNA-binding MurR/RpiR family transcriptional regulator